MKQVTQHSIDSVDLSSPWAFRIPGYTHYRLIRVGGMAAVYEARRHKDGARVALKVLRATSDLGINERFFGEAAIGRFLEDPGFVKVFEFGRADDVLWLTMELLEGVTLEDLAQDRTLELSVRRDLIVQAGRTLEVAHRHGVVHRDVKATNVIVQDDGQTRILDFGIALAASMRRSTRTGIVLGSPIYMAPEQFWRDDCDARVDIYSLGVLAYQLFSGRLPWDDVNDDWIPSVASLGPAAPFEPIGTVTPKTKQALGEIVQRAFRTERDERYTTMGDFAEALEKVDLERH